MTEVVLYHHIQGLTEGVRSFANEVRQAGHTVHTPDLFDGRTFATMDEAFAFVRQTGDALDAKADEPRTRCRKRWCTPASRGASAPRSGSLRHVPPGPGAPLRRCYPISGEYAFGPWPDDLPVQIHGKADDEFFAQEGDIDAARELVATIGPDQAELFVYPGGEHLFIDPSLPTYDANAAALVTERTLRFLSKL